MIIKQKLIIDTGRLQIRNLRNADLADFYFYRSNPEVTKYQGFDVFTIEQASDFIQELPKLELRSHTLNKKKVMQKKL